MKQDDPHERTNAASGCASNDGEAILAAVREQHRQQAREASHNWLWLTCSDERKEQLAKARGERR